MQNILITGKNSYIGKSLILWFKKKSHEINIKELSLLDDSWKDYDFSQYDVVIHCAGIAHIKESKNIKDLYYKVNRDLAIEVAKKAKSEGVKQFIFFSSLFAIGTESKLRSQYEIKAQTNCDPKTFYGKSKFEAEKVLQTLSSDEFKVVILRPPMVYGPNCKGNYVLLSKLARKAPIFPKIKNQRSMIFIYNLAELIRLIIDNQSEGIFMPQNKEYVCTSDLVNQIAKVNRNKIYLSRFLGFLVKFFGFSKMISKVFGNLVYDKNMSDYFKYEYCIYSFEESVEISEHSKNI